VEASCCPAVGAIEDGDAVVTFNFRADRMLEISKANSRAFRHIGWASSEALWFQFPCGLLRASSLVGS
jgi:bisphosphoglycerate-independent phosphoglycerate mutase (AlkP superfamily)